MTVILSYSQNSYPKNILLNKDTFVVITKEQLKKINKDYYTLELLDSLSSLKEINIALLESTIEDYKEIIKNQELIIINKEGVINIHNSTNQDLQKNYKKALNKYRIQKIKTIIASTLSGISGVGFGVIIGTFTK